MSFARSKARPGTVEPSLSFGRTVSLAGINTRTSRCKKGTAGWEGYGLDGLFDEPGPQAPSTDPDPLGRAVYQGSHGLKIRVEDAPRPVVRMADLVPAPRTFSAEFTRKCHDCNPFL